MDKRIYLRALEPDDYKVSIVWRKDQEIWNMLGGAQYFVSEAFEKKWVENTIFNEKELKLAVCTIDNDTYIGNVYITGMDMINRSCEVHVLIGNKSYWGEGYAGEALKELLNFVFNERGMNRVTSHVLESNTASAKVLRKLGFQVEGVLRQAIYKNGVFQNQLVMSVLKNEFCCQD